MNFKIALIRGDGIGPEIVGEAAKVIETVGEIYGHSFEFVDVMMGGCAIDAVGKSYPDGTAEACKACDAVLLGAVGGPKWGHSTEPEKRCTQPAGRYFFRYSSTSPCASRSCT